MLRAVILAGVLAPVWCCSAARAADAGMSFERGPAGGLRLVDGSLGTVFRGRVVSPVDGAKCLSITADNTARAFTLAADAKGLPLVIEGRLLPGRLAAFPCRVTPSDPRVVQLSLGDVISRSANAAFDAAADCAVEVVAGSGTGDSVAGGAELTLAIAPGSSATVRIHRDLYRKTLGIPYYKPIDKSLFPLPPTGWCSWYQYYTGIDQEEMRRNTDWLADNLKPYGLEYVQLDDGFQTESWTRWNDRFASGGTVLCDYIKSRGLKPGLWLTPYSQGDRRLVGEHPEWFLRDSSGNIVETFKGPLTVDLSCPGVADQWMRKLFRDLNDMGWAYYKIDGQPNVVDAFRGNQERFLDKRIAPDDAYRAGLTAIKDEIGPERYLLGCWGIPLEGVGIMDGSRTGGDVGPSWGGFQASIACTMRWYFMHNVVWYNDPDCLLLHEPLTVEQARAWATLYGVTGQHLMISERTYDLPAERMDLARRVMPATDIRPMDLYPYGGRPGVWDLKVSKGGRSYDVVALFNWDAAEAEVSADASQLGLDPALYAAYELWTGQFLGYSPGGVGLRLPPTSARAVVLARVEDHPVLLSSSRHFTAGAFDVADVEWNAATRTLSGACRLVPRAPTKLTFVSPPGSSAYVPASATVSPNATVEMTAAGPLSDVTLTRERGGTVRFAVRFAKAAGEPLPAPSSGPLRLTGDRPTPWLARLSWPARRGALGYRVLRDGEVIGFARGTSWTESVNADADLHYAVVALGPDGSEAARSEWLPLPAPPAPEPPPAPDMPIERMSWSSAGVGWGQAPQKGKSIQGLPLRIAGLTYEHGIGAHAHSEIVYPLDGSYSGFVALVGVDDEVVDPRAASVIFEVRLDGQLAWRSPVMHGGMKPFPLSVPLGGAKELRLVVTDAGDGIGFDHGDWANAGFLR